MPYDSTEVVLGGRYSLGEVLGTGRSATVYEATDQVMGVTAAEGATATAPRRLAAKVLHAHIARDPAMREAFVREARAGARVQHAGLVTVLDVGEEDIADEPVVWMIMVQAPGITLAEAVRSHSLSLTAALMITSRVLDALAAVHDAGFVHRDISPGNVMVELTDPGGSSEHVGPVRVLDLGLAGAQGLSIARSVTDPMGRPDAHDVRLVTGTPEFMSPEQARGLPFDARGDLYAVGALLYLMLTGHAPFERSDPVSVLQAHVLAPIPVPSARAEVPAAVDRLVSQSMAKSPSRRFASAAEMRAAVEGLGETSRSSNTGTRVLPALDGPSARTEWVAVPNFDRAESPTTARIPLVVVPSAAAMPHPAGQALPTPVLSPRPAVQALPPPAPPERPPVPPPRPLSIVPRPLAEARARHLSKDVVLLAICVLAICGLLGVGWMASAQAPTAVSLPLVSPTAVTGSPSPSASATPVQVPPAAASPTLSQAPTADPSPSQPIVSAAPEPSATPTLLPQVAVPWLVSLGVDQARLQLEAVGLVLGDVQRQDSAEPAGTVLTMDPPAGQTVLAGSVVRLTVASGQNLVPPVIGLLRDQAIETIRSAGLVPVLVAAAAGGPLPGQVVGVSPDPATSVALGSVVTVSVSDGPAPSGPPTSVPPTVEPIP
jgi:eukaryotic-like serine/threonine-protein kinase